MFTQSIFVGAVVALCGVALIGASIPYAPTYNDAASSYEPQPSYHHQPAPYKQPAMSYEPPASYHPQPASYHAAPSYPKYNAPSSAHHTQYDNYYPKQTYSKPMYAPPKQYSPPAPVYYQPPQPQYHAPAPAYSPPAYSAPPSAYAPAKPAAYPAPASAYGHHDMEEYKAKA